MCGTWSLPGGHHRQVRGHSYASNSHIKQTVVNAARREQLIDSDMRSGGQGGFTQQVRLRRVKNESEIGFRRNRCDSEALVGFVFLSENPFVLLGFHSSESISPSRV